MARFKLEYTGMFVLFGCVGCSGSAVDETNKPETEGGSNKPPILFETTSVDLTTSRPDYVSSVSQTGNWGTYTGAFCPYPEFLAYVGTASQPFQGSGEGSHDDAAMFAGYMGCVSRYDGSGSAQPIYNPDLTRQIVGNLDTSRYLDVKECAGNLDVATNPIKAFRQLWESAQGSGTDDTSTNAVEYTCFDGTTIQPTHATSWGSWTSVRSCPAGTAACGMELQIEGPQGGGDDTGVNGVKLHCCTWEACTSQETQNCAAFGCSCNNHQCAGGNCLCTSDERLNCQRFGCFCSVHQCTGGNCP